jgi:hypothetical protein
MHEQLVKLRELTEMPHVTLQILPFSAGAHVAMGSSFRVLQLAEPAGARVIYVEDLMTADYLDGPSQISRYSLVFDRLQIAAPSEAETTALLDQAIRESRA